MILGNLLIVSDHLSTWLVCSNLWTCLFTEEIDPLSTNCLKDNSETLTAMHSYCQVQHRQPEVSFSTAEED